MNRTKHPAGSITDVAGIEVGHFTDPRRPTGCTVIITRDGAVAGVDVRGAAPGTRETDLLHPSNLVDRVHAITLAGGSAWGLDAASGVMQWLEQNHIGLQVGFGLVPIVPAAVLFDLPVGDATIGVIATDALLTKTQAHRLAQVAHDGLARTINPVHAMLDGDTLFALGTGQAGKAADMLLLSTLAAEGISSGGMRWPAACDLLRPAAT